MSGSGFSSLHHLLNPEPQSRQSHTPPRRTLSAPLPRISSSPAIGDSEEDLDEFFALEDLEDNDNETDVNMPLSTRNTSRRHSVVDLTDTPDTTEPTPSLRRKRSTNEGPAQKRARIIRTREDVEEYDLTEENPSVEEELRQAQQKATVHAQQAEIDAGPQKLGSLQCIICMDSYTNATATACGMF